MPGREFEDIASDIRQQVEGSVALLLLPVAFWLAECRTVLTDTVTSEDDSIVFPDIVVGSTQPKHRVREGQLSKLRPMTRQQMWKQKYRLRPYLQHSTEAEIAERLRYVIENMTTLTQDGKTGVLPPEPYGKYWYELFEHLQEEYKRRGIGPPDAFLKDASVPNAVHPISAAALKAINSLKLPPAGTYLAKFGMRAHMSDFYERGELRISPAGIYADPSLNPAIRDDELSLSAFGQQNEVLIEIWDPKKGALKHATRPIGNLTYTSKSKTDYYVFCMATSLDARLFGDFGYDACLIIRDRIEFERRLNQAVSSQLPGWSGGAGPVCYLDPFNCKKDDMNVLMGKHIKYSYQHEYRCVWLPPALAADLKPLFVKLGSMRDISELVLL